jgi:transcriptional regulator with XRE-family HTH domain
MNFRKLIETFKSQKQLADILGINYSTVSQWKRRGRIPAYRISQILDIAATEKLQLTADDFFTSENHNHIQS